MADTATPTMHPPAPSTATVTDGVVTAEHLASLNFLISNLEAEKAKAITRNDLFMHKIFTAILAFVGKIKIQAEARALREARAADRKYIKQSSKEAQLRRSTANTAARQMPTS